MHNYSYNYLLYMCIFNTNVFIFSEPFVSCRPDAFLPLKTSVGLSPTTKQSPPGPRQMPARSPVRCCQPLPPPPPRLTPASFPSFPTNVLYSNTDMSLSHFLIPTRGYFLLMIFLKREKRTEREGWRERCEREIAIGCLLYMPQAGIEPAT